MGTQQSELSADACGLSIDYLGVERAAARCERRTRSRLSGRLPRERQAEAAGHDTGSLEFIRRFRSAFCRADFSASGFWTALKSQPKGDTGDPPVDRESIRCGCPAATRRGSLGLPDWRPHRLRSSIVAVSRRTKAVSECRFTAKHSPFRLASLAALPVSTKSKTHDTVSDCYKGEAVSLPVGAAN
jgi:hypothetical protein